MSSQSEQNQGEPSPLDQLAAWIETDYDYERPRRREIREATVVLVGEDQIVVDLGAKRDGVVVRRDLEHLDRSYIAALKVGDTVPVSIVDADHHDEILVSLREGLAQEDWLRASRYLESGDTCEAPVTEVNRGGVVVRFGRIRGFVPNSHLSSIRRGLSREQLDEAKAALIGKALHVSVIEVDRRQRRLVLSERAAARQRRDHLLEELSPGEVCTGTVRNLASFGAFVDLGGIDGLIHVSEMDWRRVKHPGEVVAVGDEVQVYVLDVDRDRGRIALSRRRLLPDPWPLVVDAINEGETIEGTVTNLASFGAFVDIGDGVEGLVHVSQIPGGPEAMREIERGARVRVKVLRIDAAQRRVSLSLRDAGPSPV